MLGDRESIAFLQSDFYRNKFRKILGWLMISIGIIFVLIAVIIYLILFAAPVHYYANTTDGKILYMPKEREGS